MLVRRPDVASGVRRRSDLTPEPQHFKEEQTNPAWAFAQLCRLGFGLVTVSYTNLVGQIRISRSPTHATNATGDWFLPHRIWALSGLPPSAGLSRGGRMLLFVFSATTIGLLCSQWPVGRRPPVSLSPLSTARVADDMAVRPTGNPTAGLGLGSFLLGLERIHRRTGLASARQGRGWVGHTVIHSNVGVLAAVGVVLALAAVGLLVI
jgi:hypothetical protein